MSDGGALPWVSVADRLPEPGVEVLIFRNGGPGGREYYRTYVMATYDPLGGRFLRAEPAFPLYDVTHWLPLSPPSAR